MLWGLWVVRVHEGLVTRVTGVTAAFQHLSLSPLPSTLLLLYPLQVLQVLQALQRE
jgi:hypothetical protein